ERDRVRILGARDVDGREWRAAVSDRQMIALNRYRCEIVHRPQISGAVEGERDHCLQPGWRDDDRLLAGSDGQTERCNVPGPDGEIAHVHEMRWENGGCRSTSGAAVQDARERRDSRVKRKPLHRTLLVAQGHMQGWVLKLRFPRPSP